MTERTDFVIYTPGGIRGEEAEKLSKRTGAAVVCGADEAEKSGFYLLLDGNGAALCGSGMELRADLTRMIPRLRRDNLNSEMIVRAAKPKSFGGSPSALDATAGFGEDSLLLAAAGFTVTMCERDPVVAALLRDSLERAASVPELSEAASRMTLLEADSVEYMRSLGKAPDLILLDPMFPERKKSGLIRKKLQLIQMLESPCGNEEELLSAALGLSRAKVIVKRPAKGPYLAGKKPDYSVGGNTVRCDCFAPRRETS